MRPISLNPRAGASGITGYLIVLYVVLIAYVSLTPFSGWRAPSLGIWSFLTQSWPHYITRFDVAINVLAYLPLGLLLYAYLAQFGSRNQALVVSVTAGLLLSLAMELLQSSLASRTASNLDFFANGVGCLTGALLSAWLGRNTAIEATLLRMRRELFLPGKVVDIGLVLLCVWLISQLNPSIPFFGAGVVTDSTPPFDDEYDYEYGTQPHADVPFALGTALNFCGLGLFVTTLMRNRFQALVAVQVLLGLAFSLKLTAAHALLRPQVVTEWHSDETLAGLAAGFVILLPLCFVRLNRRIYLAAVLILAGGLLSKLAGSYASLREVLRLFDWPYGQLLHFTGLTLYLNEVWPLAALIFLFAYWWRQRSAERARL
ncbi:MAG: VanZ family protein [Burkholderiales bacterium]